MQHRHVSTWHETMHLIVLVVSQNRPHMWGYLSTPTSFLKACNCASVGFVTFSFFTATGPAARDSNIMRLNCLCKRSLEGQEDHHSLKLEGLPQENYIQADQEQNTTINPFSILPPNFGIPLAFPITKLKDIVPFTRACKAVLIVFYFHLI